jgi:hypothetical protein
MTKLPGVINSHMMGREAEGRVSAEIFIPKGAIEGWEVVNKLIGPFNPSTPR